MTTTFLESPRIRRNLGNAVKPETFELAVEFLDKELQRTIACRSRSGKPLIVTTNLTLTELQNPQDTPHARIYDRLLEMCAPVCFSGENFRRESAQNKLNRLKQLMND